jgi:hypothetical protein
VNVIDLYGEDQPDRQPLPPAEAECVVIGY